VDEHDVTVEFLHPPAQPGAGQYRLDLIHPHRHAPIMPHPGSGADARCHLHRCGCSPGEPG
jgi:hypothetical protein